MLLDCAANARTKARGVEGGAEDLWRVCLAAAEQLLESVGPDEAPSAQAESGDEGCDDKGCAACTEPAFKFLPASVTMLPGRTPVPEDKAEAARLRKLANELRRDALLGVGAAQFSRGERGAATETLALLLIDDPSVLDAWELRAHAFSVMADTTGGLAGRMLVELHLEKAAELGGDEAKLAYETHRTSVDDAAASARRDDATEHTAVEVNPATLEDRLARAAAACADGDAWMAERFFGAAAGRYECALTLLPRGPELDAARVSCHLNIAACLKLSSKPCVVDCLPRARDATLGRN
ncbi:hypothetical protein M885DRAFT_126774 [Pelagophyceae sp. CCMP2097]|nr:hypothetical protein M885DRAFT_126774 [Pelagophyceae sp. CCMP2097]